MAMNEDAKNKAVELTDEETDKVAGGLEPHNQGTAWCEKCQIWYPYEVSANGKVPKHHCPPSYPTDPARAIDMA
jgi:hypothetical protein